MLTSAAAMCDVSLFQWFGLCGHNTARLAYDAAGPCRWLHVAVFVAGQGAKVHMSTAHAVHWLWCWQASSFPGLGFYCHILNCAAALLTLGGMVCVSHTPCCMQLWVQAGGGLVGVDSACGAN